MAARTKRRLSTRLAWGRAARLTLGGVGVLGLLALAIPEVLVRRARSDASECVARASSERGPVLPECKSLLGELSIPAKAPWTHHDATYRGEELLARDAVNRYLDAAVGSPDPTQLALRADDVKRAEEMVENGSQRVSLEELGPAIGAPHLGKLASSIGDRGTLIDRADTFGFWNLRVDVLEAAFLEADFDEVDEIAHRFADWDPRDADLRTAVGATLCFTDPRAGLAMLDRVPDDRAAKRYANIQRDYGEVLIVQRACAHKLGEAPPVPPPEGSAGEADADVARLAATVRLARTERERGEAIERSVGKLQSGSLDDEAPGARAALLAGVLTFRPELPAALALNLVAPRTEGEEPELAPTSLTVSRILGEHAGLHAYAPAEWHEIAASRLESLAGNVTETALAPTTSASSTSANSAIGASATGAKKLLRASGAMSTAAAIERALAGEPALAEAAARAGATKNDLSPRAAAVSIASAVYVAGDALGARRILESAPATPAKPTADDARVELEFLTLLALVSASSGDRDAAAKLATELETRAAKLTPARSAIEARWVGLAFSDAARSSAPASAPTATSRTERQAAGFPWTGMAEPHPRVREHGAVALEGTISALREALEASPEGRRAFRYAWMDHRGDLPDLATPAMIVATRLLDLEASGAAAETWLDALTTIDARRMRLRAYAFYRMEAARMRGDAVYADLWTERLRVLRRLASDPDDAEIARFLRF